MPNIFADNVQRQVFKDGVQDEIRARIPMAEVSRVDTENYETMHSRYGEDFVADSTNDGYYENDSFEYQNDTLPIEKQAVKGERIPLKDLVHSGQGSNDGWDLVDDRIDRHARGIGVKIHRDTYRKTSSLAGLVLDNEVLNDEDSAMTPIVIDSANPAEIATKMYELMQDVGLSEEDGNPYFIIDPASARQFKLFHMQNGFNTSDAQIKNGYSIIPSFDFKYIVTKETEYEQTITRSANFSTGNSVTVSGVVFTFRATPSSAGDVDLGSNLEESLANLVAAINGGNSNEGATYIKLAKNDRRKLKTVGVEASATATVLTLSAFGRIKAADSGSGTVGNEYKVLLAGLPNSTHLALPSSGYMMDEITQVPNFTGSELRSTQVHDSTVWTKDRPRVAKAYVAI